MNNVKVIKETKFKSVYISIRLLQELKQEKVAGNLILANLLNDVCQQYDTKQKVIDHLDSLYGANFSISSNVLGKVQIFAAKAKVIHPKYINYEANLIEEEFKLLHHFLKQPLMENGLFSKKWFEEAKKNAVLTLQRMQDDPSSLCMLEAMMAAGAGQPMAEGIIVDAKEIQDVTLEEVSALYFELINESKVDVMVLGDVEEQEIQEYAKTYLSFEAKDTTITSNYLLKKNNMDAMQYSYKEISQSYITSIYVTNTKNNDEDFSALRVANIMFGQIPSSLLFQEVREKNSLCYSIYSALSPYDGALSISTGVEPSNVQKTIDLMEKQFQRMCCGDFPDELLITAKKMLINSLHSTYDEADSIFAFVYRNTMFNSTQTLEDVIKNIEKVTKDEIQTAMQKCEYIMSYVVSPKEVQDERNT